MKGQQKSFLGGLLLLSLLLNSCFLSQIPEVNSHQEMPDRKVEKAEVSSILAEDFQDLSVVEVHRKRKAISLQEFVENSNSSAFLIFKEGRLIFEQYNQGFKDEQVHASFSVAKSMLSALIGVAIEEGKIASVEDEVLDYLPQLDSNEFRGMKILHLLQMTSGIRYSEIDVFHTTNAAAIFNSMKVKFTPGSKHEYWSTTYQLLGMVLEKAIKPKTLSNYMSEKIWRPMGAEADARWTVDHIEGIEKSFCCIQAIARDYGRFGLLYLNNGRFNRKQIIPEDWIQKSIAMNEEEGSVKKYNYGWWFPSEQQNEYMARGFKGQYIFINQEKKTVIVRLGANRDGLIGFKWSKILSEINRQL